MTKRLSKEDLLWELSRARVKHPVWVSGACTLLLISRGGVAEARMLTPEAEPSNMWGGGPGPAVIDPALTAALSRHVGPVDASIAYSELVANWARMQLRVQIWDERRIYRLRFTYQEYSETEQEQ